MLIKCPWCGHRSLSEFSYMGDAMMADRPADPQAVSDEEWHAYVYLRDNPRGWHDEIWHHLQGCRKMFKARRHTVTHEFASTAAMDQALTGGDQ